LKRAIYTILRLIKAFRFEKEDFYKKLKLPKEEADANK